MAAAAAAQLVLVTTEHLAASAATKQANVILVAEGDAQAHNLGARFAQTFQIGASLVGKEVEAVYSPALSAAKVVQQTEGSAQAGAADR
jgi:hypothetical protein